VSSWRLDYFGWSRWWGLAALIFDLSNDLWYFRFRWKETDFHFEYWAFWARSDVCSKDSSPETYRTRRPWVASELATCKERVIFQFLDRRQLKLTSLELYLRRANGWIRWSYFSDEQQGRVLTSAKRTGFEGSLETPSRVGFEVVSTSSSKVFQLPAARTLTCPTNLFMSTRRAIPDTF